MRRCAISAALVLGAVVATGDGARGVGLYLLLAAIPLLAVGALSFFGALVEGSADTEAGAVYVGLSTLALILVVIGTAVRANTLPDHAVPALGVSTLVGALLLLGLQFTVWTSLRLSRERLLGAARRLGSERV